MHKKAYKFNLHQYIFDVKDAWAAKPLFHMSSRCTQGQLHFYIFNLTTETLALELPQIA
jgi:hypothetical protein